jgi:hypothetical protein
MRSFMANAIPLTLAALMALGIMVIGYLLSPERILGTFGLKMLHPVDAATGFGIPLHNVSDYAFRTQRI